MYSERGLKIYRGAKCLYSTVYRGCCKKVSSDGSSTSGSVFLLPSPAGEAVQTPKTKRICSGTGSQSTRPTKVPS